MELEEGEVVCPKCKGSGQTEMKSYHNTYYYSDKCDKCHGTGRLDWVEAVVGKKKDIEFKAHHWGKSLYKNYQSIINTDCVS